MSNAYAAPQRPQSNVWPWVVGGCSLAVLAFVGFVVFVFFVAAAALRNSTPYKEAVQRAQTDPRVIAALGTPIRTRPWVFGSINVENNGGDANLEIPLSGSKAKATLHVVATKKAGRWTYTTMTVTPANGTEINLLPSSEGSARRGPPDG